MKAFKKIMIPLLCAAMFLTGCTNPFAKKEEVKKDPVYGVDEEYTKQVDNYIAQADITVKTPYGNIALMSVPDTTYEISVSHNSKPKIMKESSYLVDKTDNKKNTEGRFITHFSYTRDLSDPALMSVAMVLQSADIPQSIFMNKDNAIHKYYTATQASAVSSSAISASYPNGKKEDISVYEIHENGTAISKKKGSDRTFSYVYIIPYNEGYVLMETYAPQDRNESSIFGIAAEKVKSSIGDKETAVQLRKFIEKNRDKLIADDERATVDECRQYAEGLISGITLADYNKTNIGKRIVGQVKKKDPATYLANIPEFKAETKLIRPEYNDFKPRLLANGYKETENTKKEKPDKILHYLDYPNMYESRTYASYIMFDFNKNAAKKYKELKKSLPKKEGSQTSEITGINFKLSYGYDTSADSMWAIYLFKSSEDHSPLTEFYDIDSQTGKRYCTFSVATEDMPEIIAFHGTIKDVTNAMHLIKFTSINYTEDGQS